MYRQQQQPFAGVGVCRGGGAVCPVGWGVSAQVGGGVCPGGVCPGRCLPKRGVCLGGVCPGEGGVCLGVSAQEGVCLGVSAKVEVVSVQMEGCLPGGDVCPGEGGAICQVSVCLGGV